MKTLVLSFLFALVVCGAQSQVEKYRHEECLVNCFENNKLSKWWMSLHWPLPLEFDNKKAYLRELVIIELDKLNLENDSIIFIERDRSRSGSYSCLVFSNNHRDIYAYKETYDEEAPFFSRIEKTTIKSINDLSLEYRAILYAEKHDKMKELTLDLIEESDVFFTPSILFWITILHKKKDDCIFNFYYFRNFILYDYPCVILEDTEEVREDLTRLDDNGSKDEIEECKKRDKWRELAKSVYK